MSTSTASSRNSRSPGITSSREADCCRNGQPSRCQPSKSLSPGLGRRMVRAGPLLALCERRERMATGNVVIVGGTQGLGRELAQSYADAGRDVVVTGRDQARAETAAKEIGGRTRGLGFDLAEPHGIAEQLADIGDVDYLVLAAVERDV